MSQLEDKRFDSWKEIASFLGRDVRTVRRWEDERGLPVRRVPGEGRRTIFAYQSEIEAWLRAEHLSDKEISTKALSQHGLSTAKHNRARVWGIVSILLSLHHWDNAAPCLWRSESASWPPSDPNRTS